MIALGFLVDTLSLTEGTSKVEKDTVEERACRVLVVEDERHIARLLEHVLSKEGYEVLALHDAESAFEAIEEFQPDAMLLDIGLPGISGLDFLKQIRKEPRWAKTVAVVLSAHWFEHDDPSLAEAGATAECPKPIAPSRLLRTLRECGLSPTIA